MLDKQNARQLKRLLKLLNKYQTVIFDMTKCSKFYRLDAQNNIYSFAHKIVAHAIANSLICLEAKEIRITSSGSAHLKRLLNPDLPFIAQNAVLENSTIQMGQRSNSVVKNKNESPLSRLFYRKDKNGVSWLEEAEFNAGEKLRSDFEKSKLQPKISANWSSSVASKGATSATDISDFALDAKARINKSLAVLGPELSGVAIDVCCFLKGLETIEREKGWPPRSAKLILKTALSVLVRHYGIANSNIASRNCFWGGEHYRPEL